MEPFRQVVRTSIVQFAQGHSVSVVPHEGSRFSRAEIVARAESREVLSGIWLRAVQSSELFATYCTTGLELSYLDLSDEELAANAAALQEAAEQKTQRPIINGHDDWWPFVDAAGRFPAVFSNGVTAVHKQTLFRFVTEIEPQSSSQDAKHVDAGFRFLEGGFKEVDLKDVFYWPMMTTVPHFPLNQFRFGYGLSRPRDNKKSSDFKPDFSVWEEPKADDAIAKLLSNVSPRDIFRALEPGDESGPNPASSRFGLIPKLPDDFAPVPQKPTNFTLVLDEPK